MKQLFEALLKIGQRIFLVYSLLINISWAQSSKGTIASMDNILNEAGSLKSFLSSPVLRERYFKELTLYMEEESNFLI